MESLSDEVLSEVLSCLGVWELGQALRVWRGLEHRTQIWKCLCESSLGTRLEMRASKRRRLSASGEFGRIVRLRRINAEDLRARFERSQPSLACLRRLMDDVVPFDINLRSPDTLLHVVVADERLSKRTTLRCVRELLARGADPRLPNDVGLTPLMSAAALGDLRVVSELVPLSDLEARGRHPNGFIGAPVRPGQEARTACEWAEFYGHAEVVSALNPGDGAKKKKRELYCLQDNCIYDRRNVGEMVCCDTCGTWIHTECARIPLSVFRDLARRSSSKYECPICADCRRRRREAGEPCE